MELFKLFGTILVDNDKANESISKTDKKAEGLATKFKNGVSTVGKWGTAIVGASAVVGGALLGVANNSASAMDEIDKMSAKIGVSKQGYQEWKYVMGQNGMEISKLETGMKTLVGQMDKANEGNKTSIATFDKLGISIYDASGKMKDQETIMNETMYALADMENGTEKARLATELFGKAGIEMMPMLNGGSEGMKDLTQRAHDLGLVVSDEAVTSGVVFGDTMDDLKQTFGIVITKIGTELIPVFQKIADWVLANMPQIQSTVGRVINTIGNILSVFMKTVSFLWDSGLKVTFEGILDFIDGVFSGDWKKIWNGLIKFYSGIWSGIKTIASKPLNALSDFVKGIVNKIKGFFNFSISFPKIKLPHFSIRPSGWDIGDLLKGKIPTLGISWYAKAMDDGMILDKPTIFGAKNGQLLGAGEVGSETVVGTHSLMNMIQTAVNKNNERSIELMEKTLQLLSMYIPQIASQNPQLLLDTGVLVSEIAPKIDMELGIISRMKGRGL